MDAFDASRDEMAATARRFVLVAERWCLTLPEIGGLLGIDPHADLQLSGFDLGLALDNLGEDAERRMRLLVDVDGLLPRLIGEGDAGEWLRNSTVGLEGVRVLPLEALSRGPGAIRSLRNFLQELPEPSSGGTGRDGEH
jgi:hypothetical protein